MRARRTAGAARLLAGALVLCGSAAEAQGTDSATAEPEGSAAAAPAEPPVEETPAEEVAVVEPAQSMRLQTTGFLDTRLAWQRVHPDGLLPTDDLPGVANTTEGNVQLKLGWGERALAGADLSLVWQHGWVFQRTRADGRLVGAGAHDVASLRPAAIVSELYGSVNFGSHAHLTLGKKRVVWGSGLAQNPTDLLDPPKDPTDPAFQRAGAWLARLELPFRSFTLSLVGAAKVLRQYAGLPTAAIWYPGYPTAEAAAGQVPDDRDDFAHWAAAARLYALLADTDLNLVYAFTDRYNDLFARKSRVGLSASRVFGAFEVHVESLLQTGSSRRYADPDCIGSVSELLACALDPATRETIVSASKLGDGVFRPRVLAGVRWMGEDNELLSVEYYYNGEGWSTSELSDLLRLVTAGKEAQALLPPGQAGPKLPSLFGDATADPGTPQKFVFEPLRRHYLFATFLKPNVRNDFTLQAVLVLGLEDLSGQLMPSVLWSVREWVTVQGTLSLPVPGVESLGLEAGGRRWTEADVMPADWRAWVSARVFY